MSDADLVALLRYSRTRNEQSRLSGMLLYKHGNFMQVLEGEEEAVMATFGRIKADPRHKNIDILRAEYIQHRNFPDWTMGFANVDDIAADNLPGFSRLLERDFRSAYFSEDSIEAHAMLMAFKGATVTSDIEH